ncbi:MAG: M24 family metallopeptidase [Acidobacteriota bacterium]
MRTVGAAGSSGILAGLARRCRRRGKSRDLDPRPSDRPDSPHLGRRTSWPHREGAAAHGRSGHRRPRDRGRLQHVLFHGTINPQRLRSGNVVLFDGGTNVDGYQSDITRTTVFGTPTQRQRDVWDLEKRAQTAGFEAARVGAPCEAVDAAARKVIVDAGFGPDYKTPGLPHRTGHGIGLDGHEWTNFVRGNKTPLAPGMCFSDEPMIAIPGEFGIRLEDGLYMTEQGPRFFTAQSPAVDRPFADRTT